MRNYLPQSGLPGFLRRPTFRSAFAVDPHGRCRDTNKDGKDWIRNARNDVRRWCHVLKEEEDVEDEQGDDVVLLRCTHQAVFGLAISFVKSWVLWSEMRARKK